VTRSVVRLLAAAALVSMSTSAPAADSQPFTPAPAAIATTGATLRLGKCVNISNMLEAPREGDWGRAFQTADIANIAAKGFTAIRLPARFSGHAKREAPYTIDTGFMKRVRKITDLATVRGMSVIVDMHHYEEIFKDPIGEAPRFAAMWRQIAAAFKDAPDNVYFELINEPHDKFDGSNLLAVQEPALAAVRESNPTRPVVINGPSWSSLTEMLKMNFPDDPNVVPTFHYYDPANFGFDKAPWMNPPVREDFGTAADVAELREITARLKAWMAKTGRVPFVGELGAHESRSVAMRATYYALTSAAFASIGVQNCVWGYTNTHQLWRDDKGWEPGIADGLVTTATLPPR
jgi:endoglucanase